MKIVADVTTAFCTILYGGCFMADIGETVQVKARSILASLAKWGSYGRAGNGQFCVMGFNTLENGSEYPSAADCESSHSLQDLMKNAIEYGNWYSETDSTPYTWIAAYYDRNIGTHTEQVLLDVFDQWCSAYSHIYDPPTTLYIYSFLIPCQRDAQYGMCAESLANLIRNCRKYGIQNVYIGWGNGDRNLDDRAVTQDTFADLDDAEDGTGVKVRYSNNITFADASVQYPP